MLQLFVQTLILASSGLLSAGSVTLVILLLISGRGWQKGLAYALGYTGSYCIIGVSAVLFGYRKFRPDGKSTYTAVSVLLLFLGLLLLWIAFRNIRKPVSGKKDPPRFFSFVDNLSPLKALGFGSLVSLINFKNLTMYLTAISGVILSGLDVRQKIIIALAASITFCLSVLIPVGIYLMFPKHAGIMLNKIKNTIQNRGREISIFAPVIFAAIFILKGISQLL